MDFANERYVRLYVRDTMTWKRIGWEGRAVLPQLLRKLDRSGVFDLSGLEPCEAVAAMLDMPIEVARPGTERLIETGTVELGEDCLVVPRFLEGQETPQSDAQRCREYRARRRDTKRLDGETKRIANDTSQHAATRRDTPSFPSVPSKPAVGEKHPPAPIADIPEDIRRALEASEHLRPLLNGSARPDWWRKLAALDHDYPWLHVAEEIRGLDRWLVSNPDKPRKRLAAFVMGCLNRRVTKGIEQGLPEARRFA